MQFDRFRLKWFVVVLIGLFLLVWFGGQQTWMLKVHHPLNLKAAGAGPKRVVTLFQGATDTMMAFDLVPVGVAEARSQQRIYRYMQPFLEGVAHVGLETQPNLDSIARLKPDLIIASKARHEPVYSQLSTIAPTIMLPNEADFKVTLTLMGQALNKEQQAQQILGDWHARVAHFQDQVSQDKDTQWPMNVALLNFNADHARIYQESTFSGSVLKELGFIRPAAQANDDGVIKLTSKESIPAMNADIFFYFMTEDDLPVEYNFEQWTQHPLWKNLDAVKNGKVYRVNQEAWDVSSGITGANMILDQIFEHLGYPSK